jgi:hypothetical protein
MLYNEESCRFILDLHRKHGLSLTELLKRVDGAFKRVPYAIIQRVAVDATPAYGYVVQLLRLRDHPDLAEFLELVTGMEVCACLELLAEADNTPVKLPSDRSWRALRQQFADPDYLQTLRAPRAVHGVVDAITREPYPHIAVVAGIVLNTRIALGQVGSGQAERDALIDAMRVRMLNAFLGHAGCRIPAEHETD